MKTNEFTSFFGQIAVLLHDYQEQRSADGQMVKLAGYYRNMAVLATGIDHAKHLISIEVADGRIDWEDTTLQERSLSEIEGTLARDCDSELLGVWYQSGRVFFPPDTGK